LSLLSSLRASELDPLDPIINVHLGWHYWLARQPDQAIEQCRKTVELDPNSFWPSFFAGLAYEQKGIFDEAIREFQNARTLSQGFTYTIAGLGHTYAVAGEIKQAEAVLDELKNSSKQKHVPAYDLAVTYAGLGERDDAFAWLEKAYQEHSGWLAYLKVEPRLDSFRSDPRFGDLMQRVDLAPKS
jgi:tetratricopeptide (TPR) repeat protein